MLRMIKPRYFVPIHGEYHHLVAHAGIAVGMGVAPEHTFILEDGDVLELGEDGAEIVDKVPAATSTLWAVTCGTPQTASSRNVRPSLATAL